MNIAAIEAWLVAHTGLVADRLGPGQVARIAHERLLAAGCADAEAYVALLTSSPIEQLQFIEAIVVGETWFFRDRAALDGLVRHVAGPWAVRHPSGACRVLSVPCSTGEEPYSIAMALAHASWPVSRLQIDAVDISRDSIARGTAGIYRKNSFRGADLKFREIFFDFMPPAAWSVRATVRAPVRFQEANFFAEDFAAGRSRYDAIFCRNLLIYFERPVQTRAFETLSRLLTDDGLLAVGPAEAMLALEHGFSPVPGESMFLFQKAARKPAVMLAPVVPSRPRLRRPVAPRVTKLIAPICAGDLRRPEPVVPPLQKLRALADTGRLREAAEWGELLLRESGASVELCYLLAIVADAAGDVRRAEEYYRKTLYLDPRHADSLAHLALLLDKRGDTRGASTLRARSRRAMESPPGPKDAKEVA